jgi:hypothetical protein
MIVGELEAAKDPTQDPKIVWWRVFAIGRAQHRVLFVVIKDCKQSPVESRSAVR